MMDKKLEFEDLLRSYMDARDDYLNAMATTDDFTATYQKMKKAELALYDWVEENEKMD